MINHIILAGLLSVLIAQFSKVIVNYYHQKRWDWHIMFATGMMPSTHSSMIVSSTVVTGYIAGVNSPAFGIMVIVTLIITHDAFKVRGEINKQAKVINILAQEVAKLSTDQKRKDQLANVELRENVGHNPQETLAGIILGIGCGLAYILILL